MYENRYQSDVVIVGGGIAGIVVALELLDSNNKVIIIDRDKEENFGGLAKESFGGIFFVGTPTQKRSGYNDSIDLATKDWFSFAEFEENAVLPKKWAEAYINRCTPDVYRWLRKQGIGFFPVVHWVERGWDKPGNSVPRFHMVWGTGYELIRVLTGKLARHKNRKNLTTLFRHKVDDILVEKGEIAGVSGIDETDSSTFSVMADHVVVATGGISGSVEKVKQHWRKELGEPPETILNGSHQFATGSMHDLLNDKFDAKITHLDNMWHYAAGVHHHKPQRPDHGLSLIPPKSALWMDYTGKRFDPPLISGYDTRHLVETVSRQEKKYSWQILNYKIAKKELSISGAEFNKGMRDKSIFRFLKDTLLGNKSLADELIAENMDFIVGDSIEELVDQMHRLTNSNDLNINNIKTGIEKYDAAVERARKTGETSDDQVNRIVKLRKYRGEKVRTIAYQKINDKNALPLIAIREHILSRKSLGGIQTDLNCNVMKSGPDNGALSIPGLYAVGEAAGFGGGGMHGKRSLEGTFLGGCILTGRIAAETILKG